MYREVISANSINPIKKEIPEDRNRIGAATPEPSLRISSTPFTIS